MLAVNGKTVYTGYISKASQDVEFLENQPFTGGLLREAGNAFKVTKVNRSRQEEVHT